MGYSINDFNSKRHWCRYWRKLETGSIVWGDVDFEYDLSGFNFIGNKVR